MSNVDQWPQLVLALSVLLATGSRAGAALRRSSCPTPPQRGPEAVVTTVAEVTDNAAAVRQDGFT